MKTIKVIKKSSNEKCEAIQYTGNYGDIIDFINAPNNIWFINENFYINTLSSCVEVAKYNDYIIKDKYGKCNVCKFESMFNCYKEV